jgi:predicted PurR-regulated permease PerM
MDPMTDRIDLVRNMLAVLFIAGLLAASLWIVYPFLPALIWATLLVVSTWPLKLAVQQRLWGKRGLAVIVMSFALLLIVLVPLAMAVATIVANADNVVSRLETLTKSTLPPPPAWLEKTPLVGAKAAAEWQTVAALTADELHARVAPHLQDAGRWVLAKAGTLAIFLLHLLLTALIAPLLYYYGETAASGVLAFAQRLGGIQGEQSVTLAAQAIKAVALGVVVTALVQSTLGGLGLFIAGVPLAAFLTALMFVLAIAQIGALPVLLCAAVWLYWKDTTVTATVFLVWALIVGSIDNVLRPILIKRGADLPLLLIFSGVIGGLIAFGVVGLFIGPVVLAVVYTLLVGWVRQGRRIEENPVV